MPRYYFHVREGETFVEDPDGVILADLAAAHQEAFKAAREILSEWVLKGKRINGQEFVICDESGQPIAQIPFRSALHIE